MITDLGCSGERTPLVVAYAGRRAEEKFVEFFTAGIRNRNTRAAYFSATRSFFDWVHDHRLALDKLRPTHVAAYVEFIGRSKSPPTVKQHLAAIRMLFDHLVVGQVVEMNPAAAVRGPRHSAKTGRTPVLSEEEARGILAAIDTSSLVGLRDRAALAFMVYSFARVGALVGMNVEDYFSQGRRWWVRLREKGGKRHEVPCHHRLEEYLDAYVTAAALWDQKRQPLFRSAAGRTEVLSPNRLSRTDVYRMVQRRAAGAGVETALGCHSFRATGITNYLLNGGALERAQQLAGHESVRTTKLYDRRDAALSLDEVERISI
jgi:site-specific recombinase XerD